jgi:hypothetical protein
VEELGDGGSITSAFSLQLGKGDDRLKPEATRLGRTCFNGRNVEVLAAHPSLISSNAEQALECLHDSGLASTVASDESSEAGVQIYIRWFGPETTKI